MKTLNFRKVQSNYRIFVILVDNEFRGKYPFHFFHFIEYGVMAQDASGKDVESRLMKPVQTRIGVNLE